MAQEPTDIRDFVRAQMQQQGVVETNGTYQYLRVNNHTHLHYYSLPVATVHGLPVAQGFLIFAGILVDESVTTLQCSIGLFHIVGNIIPIYQHNVWTMADLHNEIPDLIALMINYMTDPTANSMGTRARAG